MNGQYPKMTYKTIVDTLAHIEIYVNGVHGRIVIISPVGNRAYEALIECPVSDKKERYLPYE